MGCLQNPARQGHSRAMLRHINITDIDSVAKAREATRDIAASLDFADWDLRLALNIVTEIALSSLDGGAAGEMSLSGIEYPDLRGICIMNRFPVTSSAGDGTLNNLECSSLPLAGMKNLSDHFRISLNTGEVVVNAVKWASTRRSVAS